MILLSYVSSHISLGKNPDNSDAFDNTSIVFAAKKGAQWTIHTLQAIGLEEGIAEMMLRTKSGKLELRFDEDIADFVIANVEAAWRLKGVLTSMQELEESLVAQKPQSTDIESL